MLYRIGWLLIVLALLATGWAFAATDNEARLDKDVAGFAESRAFCDHR